MASLSESPQHKSLVTHIPKEDRIPISQKIAFSLGANMDYVATGLLTGVMWMPYFNIGLGMSPVLLGFIMMLLRAWDAFSDPFMGNISDNARTKWGRRRPFMFVGAIATGCIFPLFWYMPAGLSETMKGAYLLIVGLLFFTAFTIWSMPYYGLQLELTPNYDERTRLGAWMALGGKLSGVLNGWVLAIVTSSLFLNPLTGKGDIVIGMKTAGWYIAGIIIVLGLLPVFFVKERYYATDAKRQPQEGFLKSLKDSGGCGPLWSLIGVSFFLVLGAASIGALGQYVNIYYVFGGDLSAAAVVSGWRSLVLSIGGLALLPLWTWLGERFDKKSIVIAMLCFASFGHLLGYFFLRPDMPYLQIVSGFFESAAMGALWLFLPSMKADVADYDELSTARRREGSLNAFYSWFIKAALTLSVGAGGILLSITGFDVKLPAQSPEVLNRMFLLYLILPVIIWGVAMAFAFIYPLSRNRMDDIRSELERRRGKV